MSRRKKGEPVTLDWIKSNCIVDEDTGCWIWQLTRDRDGYGQVWSQGRMLRTHRMAFQLAGGTIPSGQYVLHECDRPLCCSPKHLSAGTQLQNGRDMVSKERQARGGKNGNAKLTDETVRLIRNSPGRRMDKAKTFGVTESAISKVMLGQTWAHVAA